MKWGDLARAGDHAGERWEMRLEPEETHVGVQCICPGLHTLRSMLCAQLVRQRRPSTDPPRAAAQPQGARSGTEGLSLPLGWEAMRNDGIQPT